MHGLGGLGKTALALQYAYAYAQFYSGGRWLLNCVGAGSLAGLIRRLHVDLGVQLTAAEERDDDLAARRVLKELEDLAKSNAVDQAAMGPPGSSIRWDSTGTSWPNGPGPKRSYCEPWPSGSRVSVPSTHL